tara:strand:- start:1943 stop:2155 length:213 start_codon:yes stop_codon:yes gene_type:complete
VNSVRLQAISAVRQVAQGNIAKHKLNAEVLLERSVGVAEHGDLIETIQKELDMIAKYEDQLSVIEKHLNE